jgi:putative flippase GtrA
MSMIADLYARFRHLIHEVAKFGIVGGIGFIVTLGGTDLLHFGLGLGKYTAVTLAVIVATFVTFAGNRYWTYRNRTHVGTKRESVMFFVMNGVGLLIQYACLGIVVDGLGQSGHLAFNLANFTGVALGTIFRFFAYRRWVWKAPLEAVLEGHEELEPTAAPAGPSPAADGRETAAKPGVAR